MAKNRQKEIEEYAYGLFEQSGWEHGRSEEHWFEAERALSAQKPASRKKAVAKGAEKSKKKAASSTRVRSAKARPRAGAGKKVPATV